MPYTPIALFAYNRPHLTRPTLEALSANILAAQSDLHIFCDGPKTGEHAEGVEAVRVLAREWKGFKSVTVVERDTNFGLAKSIITGASQLLDAHGTVIVMEDDLITSPHFLAHMNNALEFYRSELSAFSVTGYMYPPSLFNLPQGYEYDAFAAYRCHSWGWATWKDRWDKVDWDVADFEAFMNDQEAQARFNRGGKDLTGMLGLQVDGVIDSWAIRFCYAHFRNEASCIYPIRSLVHNTGFDGSGVHCTIQQDGTFSNLLDSDWQPAKLPPAQVQPSIAQEFKTMFDERLLAVTPPPPHPRSLKARIKRFLAQIGLS
ncbi:MAG: glycosyltransferase family 2 protein [Okeania sp. SIO3B3]|nr:glycosyltransferase family 2 protein [Okeania sp. SIO3B3]